MTNKPDDFALKMIEIIESNPDGIQTHATQSNILCFVHKISPRIRPDLVDTPDNIIMLCEYCILDFIKAFKIYRNQHSLPESNY